MEDAGSFGPGHVAPLSAVDIDREVDRMLCRWATVGAAVGVVRPGAAPQVVTRGVADAVTGEDVTPDTAFRIASITETLPAVAVMTRDPASVVADTSPIVAATAWRPQHGVRDMIASAWEGPGGV